MLLLEMAATGYPERVAIGPAKSGLTYAQLFQRASAGAAVIRASGVERVAFVAVNGPAFPVALFAAAWAGVPLVPLNYRLSGEQLAAAIAETQPCLVIAEGPTVEVAWAAGQPVLSPAAWMDATASGASDEPWEADGEKPAVLLYTSGTTAAPKRAIQRHRHLTAYITGTVEFGSAEDTDAMLVSVPPYHIAGVSNVLSNVYAGRRVVILDSFSPEAWLDKVRDERITNALVVPTMLVRIVQYLGEDAGGAHVPTLRALTYGGAKMPMRVLERALQLFPDTDFVNAYGLTETSSTVALLGPEEHRAAMASDEPSVRARLASAGRSVPGLEVEIRSPAGTPLASGEAGEVYLRGEQISGEYVGRERATDADGWYPTRDRGFLDEEGFLFIEGRSDDTIIRGGGNIAPAEIEDVVMRHPAVEGVAVVGPSDDTWGQRICAVVVLKPGARVAPEELREWARRALRSSKTPDEVVFRSELPYTDTGKVIRRAVLASLQGAVGSAVGG